jgi:hypothetical protein
MDPINGTLRSDYTYRTSASIEEEEEEEFPEFHSTNQFRTSDNHSSSSIRQSSDEQPTSSSRTRGEDRLQNWSYDSRSRRGSAPHVLDTALDDSDDNHLEFLRQKISTLGPRTTIFKEGGTNEVIKNRHQVSPPRSSSVLSARSTSSSIKAYDVAPPAFTISETIEDGTTMAPKPIEISNSSTELLKDQNTNLLPVQSLPQPIQPPATDPREKYVEKSNKIEPSLRSPGLPPDATRPDPSGIVRSVLDPKKSTLSLEKAGGFARLKAFYRVQSIQTSNFIKHLIKVPLEQGLKQYDRFVQSCQHAMSTPDARLWKYLDPLLRLIDVYYLYVRRQRIFFFFFSLVYFIFIFIFFFRTG